MDVDKLILERHAKRERRYRFQVAFKFAACAILVVAFAWSLWGLLCFLLTDSLGMRETVGEYLVALVLAVEGLVAIAHLSASGREAQTEILRQFMDRFSSDEVLRDAQFLREKLASLKSNAYDVSGQPLTWTKKEEKRDGRTVYEVHLSDSDRLDVVIDMSDDVWACANRVIERYHAAGLLFANRHLPREEFMSWAFLPVVRAHWQLIGLIRAERVRRGSPELWQYFEELAWHMNNKRQKVSAGEPSKHGITS